jgi:hypothetical protein
MFFESSMKHLEERKAQLPVVALRRQARHQREDRHRPLQLPLVSRGHLLLPDHQLLNPRLEGAHYFVGLVLEVIN